LILPSGKKTWGEFNLILLLGNIVPQEVPVWIPLLIPLQKFFYIYFRSFFQECWLKVVHVIKLCIIITSYYMYK
jgi:hypothetical protein